MSAAVVPSPPNLPPCPPWCCPDHCHVHEGDVEHQSPPVQVRTVDAVYDLQLIRYDEVAFPEEWHRPPGLRIWVEPTHRDEPLTLHVGVTELPALIEGLSGQLLRIWLAAQLPQPGTGVAR